MMITRSPGDFSTDFVLEKGGAVLNVSDFSKRYAVRILTNDDVSKIYNLCKENSLYYEYCPPFVTRENILEDMNALPPNKTKSDKFYVGFFDGENLVAVMDFISDYPERKTAFIGFFMTDKKLQKRGVGSGIISEFIDYLALSGYSFVRLAWIKGNALAEHFWLKNGFQMIGETLDMNGHKVIFAERKTVEFPSFL